MSALVIDLRGVAIPDLPRSRRELALLAGLEWPLSPADKIKLDQAKIVVTGKEIEALKGGAA